MQKLEVAFAKLKKKYPEAARELEKEFRKAIRNVSCTIKEQVSVITVEGVGRDGRHYIAEFDAVFPAGTKILSVRERHEMGSKNK